MATMPLENERPGQRVPVEWTCRKRGCFKLNKQRITKQGFGGADADGRGRPNWYEVVCSQCSTKHTIDHVGRHKPGMRVS